MCRIQTRRPCVVASLALNSPITRASGVCPSLGLSLIHISKVEPVREWYFYTHRGTVWRVLPGEWMTDGLIAFTFDGKPQDVERFRNAPYWRERFGTVAPDKHRFGWTKFYEAIADKLLTYRNNRAALVEGIREISVRVDGLGHLAEDKYADGTTGFVKDICPFTTMGLFNRGINDSNRKIIATELAKFLGVGEAVPETFEGIPLLNNCLLYTSRCV